MIKTVIIDDEKWVNLNLRSILEDEHPTLDIVGDANSVSTGIKLILDKNPQLVFMDIQLGDGTGFDILDKLPQIDFQVIFITAYDEFAIKAFKYAAQDYLLKPLHPEDLQVAVKNTIASINQNNKFSNTHQLLAHLRKGTFDKLTIPTMSGFEFISLDHLIRIESDSSYSIFYIDGDKKYISTKTLKEYEDILADNFIRVHRSHIVNLNYVKKYTSQNGGEILMNNGDKIPISRRRRDNLLDSLESYF